MSALGLVMLAAAAPAQQTVIQPISPLPAHVLSDATIASHHRQDELETLARAVPIDLAWGLP